MDIKVKALLLDKKQEYGAGLNAVRKLESQLIDITDYEPALSDATMTAGVQYIIKNNKVYRCTMTYFDLDKNARIIVAKEDMETYDIVD